MPKFLINQVRFLSILITSIAIIAAFSYLEPARSAACPSLVAGDLFKVANNSAVYLVNSKSERLYFPTADVYKSWFEDFSGVQEISGECVDNYPAPSAPPFGVNYRPGSKLVKVSISPSVYAVLPGNNLAKIGNEEAAIKLYGDNWATLVRDIADPFWPNYAGRVDEITEAVPHEGMLVKSQGNETLYKLENGGYFEILGSLSSAAANDVRVLSDEIFNKLDLGGVIIEAADVVLNPAQENVSLFSQSEELEESDEVESVDETPTVVEETAEEPLPPPVPIAQHFCGNDLLVPQDSPYIQVAVDAACPDDTIIIGAGTYSENLEIQTNNLTLKGAPGTNPEGIIIDGGGKDNVVYVSYVRSFTIDGLTLQNSGQGDTPHGNTGLFVEPRWQATVNAKNLIVKNNGFGISLWRSKEDRKFTISNSVIINNLYDGIDNRSTTPAVMIVENNTIAGNGRHGYHDDKQEPDVRNGDVVLKNNIIVNNGGAGIHPYNSNFVQISYNNVFNNAGGNYMKHKSGSDVEFDPSSGIGELSADPLFVSETDYHLQADSPMIDAGDPAMSDADGTRLDMGAYPFE